MPLDTLSVPEPVQPDGSFYLPEGTSPESFVQSMNAQGAPPQMIQLTNGAEGDSLLPEQKFRAVAICGTAPSSRMLANQQADDCEVWALNDCYTFITRANRWFEVHERSVWEADGAEHVKFLKDFPSTVYMLDHWDDVPNSVRYPYEAIRDRFFPGLDITQQANLQRMMLGSTIDYMIALALTEDFEEIRLCGINMATSTEFTHQLPSCSYWLGVAREKLGWENVILPDNCPMLQVPIYGVSRRGFIDKDLLDTRRSRVLAQKADLEAKLNACHGALQMLDLLEAQIEAPELSKEPEVDKRYAIPKLDISHAVGDEGMATLQGVQ